MTKMTFFIFKKNAGKMRGAHFAETDSVLGAKRGPRRGGKIRMILRTHETGCPPTPQKNQLKSLLIFD